ncbi:MAG TPA: glycosyltransferase family 4 protein [Vicinamibacterales bacterium]|nr:glycosyltransferase family 4 protein [Vicinamibacterales bacterium]
MRIAVVTSSPPMAEGGHMVIARELTRALRDAGHDASILVTPQNRFGRQFSAYLATWLTDVTSSEGKPIEQVVSLRYPSYAVRHPRHVCWLNHTMREYYDLWPQFSATLSARGRAKERVRRVFIHAADRYLLAHNVTKLFVQSRTIQQRLAMWPSVRSTILHPPAPQRPYRCDSYDGSFLFVSRLDRLKRADLVVRALAAGEGTGLTLTIAGDGEERAPLERLAVELGVANRLMFAGRVPEDHLIALLATCRAVIFPPFQEDYGFVTVEAFASRKAVITCRDSGGAAELVQDGVSGLVSEPTPQALATSLRRLADDAPLAERMGSAGFETAARLTWPETVKQLVI